MKAAKARAQFTLRTQGFQAYAVARHQQQMSGMASHPYWKYETVGDSRVRASHAALDGKVLRADDPWWKTHYPPWDWGCRCIVIAIDEEDAKMYGISKSGDMPQPERSGSWSFDPSDAGISLDALTKGRDDADCRILFNGARNATVQRDDGTETTMWEYMVNRHMQAKAERLTSETERDGNERAYVLDYLTGKQIGKTEVGDERGLTLDIAEGKDVATLHTHPSGLNIPSPRDMLFGSETMSKAEYIAIGKKVRRWQWLKKPNDDDIAILEMYDADNNSGGVNLDAYWAVIKRLMKTGYIKMEELS